MPIHPPKDFLPLITHIHALIGRVEHGLPAGETITALLQSLTILGDLSTHDALTGTLNRRGLVEKLEHELDRSRRTGHPFSMAVIGLDDFPRLDEKYGSEISRQVLRNVAQEALQVLRSLDSFGRIGDDEFALILPTTWLDQSGIAIARLTSNITGLDWARIASDLQVTFSSGMTTNAHDDTAETMLTRAQDAMMQAKAKGPGSTVQLEKDLPDIDPDLL